MRYQGKVVKWFDEQGYGFIQADADAAQIFAHISGFPPGYGKPKIDEVVTFEIAEGEKGQQAYNVLYVNRPKLVIKRTHIETPERKRSYSSLIIMIFFGFIALNYLSPKFPLVPDPNYPSGSATAHPNVVNPSVVNPSVVQEIENISDFQCAGKTQCSEMLSCEEAVYYLKNCPGTLMDGDQDGRPCEDQWCN